MKINGMNHYIVGSSEAGVLESFSITLLCTPYTYETAISGLYTAYDRKQNTGIAIGVKKSGHITACFGLGDEIIEIESLAVHVNRGKRNIVTLQFWGEAGWCELYVNGQISQRKQFRRHSRILKKEGKSFWGKYVDADRYQEGSRFGIFHGDIEVIEMGECYRSYQKILEIHRSYLHKMQEEECNLYEEVSFEEDFHRPSYHLIPTAKWMNEPHAPFYDRGNYHIFYQANPHAPIWDNICWGHLISKDMIHWKELKIALYPDDPKLDMDGCWTGSVCVDQNGVPRIFYTAGNNQELPNQSIACAIPKDMGDIQLQEWNKEGIILRQSLGEGFLGEFRDPYVIYRNGEYHILVGTGDENNGGGNALVYTSPDLKEFTCCGFIMDYAYEAHTEVGHVWELPVLLPLKDENKNIVCDIFLLCACQIEEELVETYYFLGNYDEENKRFIKSHEEPRLLDLGNGIFTGPSGFVAEDGRSIVFTIAQGKRESEIEFDAGWAHNGGLPIELGIQDGELCIRPIRELDVYFNKKVLKEKLIFIPIKNCKKFI